MNKTYAFTDVHGCYNLWEQIKNYCDESDTIFFLGDACDRGDDGIKIIKELLQDKRIIYIKGNHEKFLEDIGGDIAGGYYGNNSLWLMNGGYTTAEDFEKLSAEEQQWYIKKVRNLPAQVQYTNKKGQIILLSHAGFTPTLEPAKKEDYWWDRDHIISDWWPEGEKYKETYVVHGHTPVQSLRPLLQQTRNKFTQEKYSDPIIYCKGHKIDLDVASFQYNKIILFDLDEMKIEKTFYDKETWGDVIYEG